MAYGNEKFDKRWEIRSVPVAQPAAGAEWKVSPPAGSVWRIKALVMKFVPSSTVATRQPSVYVDDGSGSALFISPSNQGIPASNTTTLMAGGGCPLTGLATIGPIDNVGGGGAVLMSLPNDLVITSSMQIGSVTNNIQTGDQWANIALLVEQADAN